VSDAGSGKGILRLRRKIPLLSLRGFYSFPATGTPHLIAAPAEASGKLNDRDGNLSSFGYQGISLTF